MCGITGFSSVNARSKEDISLMTDQVRHRGPDGHGTFSNVTGSIQLGHSRLCILDLSDAASQPFYSRDGRYVLVFNGEIYNFRTLREFLVKEHGVVFKTSGDTEVIMEGFVAWGRGLVERLEGMFAFAILDTHLEKLFIARDRVGKKPLFYVSDHRGFFFASEIKALLKVCNSDNLKMSHSAVGHFLHLGYIPSPRTIYTDIRKFPAGSMATVERGKEPIMSRYWNIHDYYISPEPKRGNEVETLHKILRQSVKERLVSDVAVGAFLSGGTDSSLVSALAQEQLGLPLKTFSIGFKNSRFDESSYARSVAEILKTDHTAYELSEDDALSLVESYLDHFDEPFADSSAIPTLLVSKLARAHVTVALTGDGGDELFQGYGSYQWAERLESTAWKMLRSPFGLLLRNSGNNRLERVGDLLQDVHVGSKRSHIFSQEQYLFSQQEVEQLVQKKHAKEDFFDYNDPNLKRKVSAAELQALFDFQYYLRDDLLVKVDMASMYYGLECRCPLLDKNVIEFSASLDPSWKIRHGESKYILKEILRKYIPDELVTRKKWGFSVPLADWLKKDLRYLIDTYLSDEVIRSASLVRPEYVEVLKKRFFSGKDYLYNRLWVLCVLHRWWVKHCSA